MHTDGESARKKEGITAGVLGGELDGAVKVRHVYCMKMDQDDHNEDNSEYNILIPTTASLALFVRFVSSLSLIQP
jgi:hypothetical protein